MYYISTGAGFLSSTAPENAWLEYYFPFEKAYFQVLVSGMVNSYDSFLWLSMKVRSIASCRFSWCDGVQKYWKHEIEGKE